MSPLMAHLRVSVSPCCAVMGSSEGLPVPPSSRKRSRVGSSGTGLSTSTLSSVVTAAPTSALGAPKPLPVIHSTAYLQKTKQLVAVPVPLSSVTGFTSSTSSAGRNVPGSSATRGDSSSSGAGDGTTTALAVAQESLEDNAIVWALKKVDDKLNEIEEHPSAAHVALFRLSSGPVGQATTQGIQAAAKVTMSATMEVAKVAAPVGKWALQQGFRAAVGLAAAAMTQQEQQQQQSSRGSGSSSSSRSGTRQQSKGGSKR